ncbi:MAG: type II toxin-antitoxin system Phd/YefM family antitoxin [Gammaproteobacteria bacterium]|nr:type II toxin-antitoxin system Phd/YefM family antitoxin [Gammaproteobacteria bacterium]
MRVVSASEAKRRLGAVLDAVPREPVTIRRQNREVAVVLSLSDYRRLTTLNVAEFQRFCDRVSASARARGLTEETLNGLLGRD